MTVGHVNKITIFLIIYVNIFDQHLNSGHPLGHEFIYSFDRGKCRLITFLKMCLT